MAKDADSKIVRIDIAEMVLKYMEIIMGITPPQGEPGEVLDGLLKEAEAHEDESIPQMIKDMIQIAQYSTEYVIEQIGDGKRIQ